MKLNIYRVVDYDDFRDDRHIIFIRDFLVFGQSYGIIVVSQLIYNDDIRENPFDINHVDIDRSLFSVQGYSEVVVYNENQLDKFDEKLDKWWNEKFYAQQIHMTGTDKIIDLGLKKYSKTIIKDIF